MAKLILVSGCRIGREVKQYFFRRNNGTSAILSTQGDEDGDWYYESLQFLEGMVELIRANPSAALTSPNERVRQLAQLLRTEDHDV